MDGASSMPGGAPGAALELVEEREQIGPGGWVGAVGLTESDLIGTHDAALFDLDGDGDRDLVLGRCFGTSVWRNGGDAPLTVDGGTLSLSAGGAQGLRLDAGPALAGATYLVLGSASGTSPGQPVDGVVLPLNADTYTASLFQAAGAPPFAGFLGTLDAAGRATVRIELAPGAVAASGLPLLLHHAFAAFGGFGQVVFASNPVPLVLTP